MLTRLRLCTNSDLCQIIRNRKCIINLLPKYCSTASNDSLTDPYIDLYKDESYNKIPELQHFQRLIHNLSTLSLKPTRRRDHVFFGDTLNDYDDNILQNDNNDDILESIGLTESEYLLLFDSALITHCIHIQSRIAAFEGKGFYTIGPCGEECLSPIGLLLELTDSMALHYRHLSSLIGRQLKRNHYNGDIYNPNNVNILNNIILDRARGYCVSINDPVSSGGHCLLGSSHFNYDFLVTSTLSSQLPPAVGRAFGSILYNTLNLPNPIFDTKTKNYISFVSVGDGSINNSHFLSGINIIEYAIHNNIKCPLLIGISNNKLCISLRDTNNWLNASLNKLYIKKFKCNANNILNVYYTFKLAKNYINKYNKPAIIIFDNIIRQFGHAATDRQYSYLTEKEVNDYQNNDLMLQLFKQSIQLNIIKDNDQCINRLLFVSNLIKNCFETVYNEPKLESNKNNRQLLMKRNCAPVVKYKYHDYDRYADKLDAAVVDNGLNNNRLVVMRKLMTYMLEEILIMYSHCVYIGEDVTHGGYYLVTDGLHGKYPLRIRDFPPDETIIFGAGIGYSHSGLLPIIEMPYAKYLDCGFDMFNESIIMYWLSNGNQSNGMIIRLQGFGNGLFGGNFHTHNVLYIPPGLDCLCYNNGYDYILGWRYSIQQANNGRIIMSVDCTQQLNNRHIDQNQKDNKLMYNLPDFNQYLTFNDIILYNDNKYYIYNKNDDNERIIDNNNWFDINKYNKIKSILNINNKDNKYKILIVTYGLGVNVARQAQYELLSNDHSDISDIFVIDTPYLSDIPETLKILLQNECDNNTVIIFADMCKEGQNPLNSFIIKLQKLNILQNYKSWQLIAAQYTYNPLGKDLTFLSKDDILDTINDLIQQQKEQNKKINI